MKPIFGRVMARQKRVFTEESAGETAGVLILMAATVLKVSTYLAFLHLHFQRIHLQVGSTPLSIDT